MSRIVTAEDLADVKMDGPTAFLSGRGFYEQWRSCKEHPALTNIRRGPRGRKRKRNPLTTVYVAGVEVTPDLTAIAAALTAHYAGVAPIPFNYDAEMQEAGEP